MSGGGFAVSYTDNGWAQSGTEITTRVYNSDGTFRTSYIEVNTASTGNQSHSSIASLSNGGFVVSFLDDNSSILYEQAYDASGNMLGSNNIAASAVVQAQIVGLASGQVVNVRESSVPDAGGGNSIRADIDQFVRTTNGDATSETLSGDALRDIINGAGGNDTMRGFGANDLINGGEGHNTAVYAGTRAQYSLTANANHSLTVVDSIATRDGTDTDSNINYVQFSDRTLIVATEWQANIARLYGAAFDRQPDSVGLNGWEDIFDNSIPASAQSAGVFVALAQTPISGLTSIATGFINSPEFAATYGANISDITYINLLYQNVLDRGPDPDGLANSLNLLAHGTSREVVLVGFAESSENIAKTGADWLVAV